MILFYEFTTFDGKWLCIFFFFSVWYRFAVKIYVDGLLLRIIIGTSSMFSILVSWDKVDENTNVERSSIISIGGRQENAR